MRALKLAAVLALLAGPACAQSYNPPTLSGLGGMLWSGSNANAAALGNIATAAGAFSWPAAQRGAVSTLTISTATFTPSFDAANNFKLTLVNASCPCTLANPSTTPVAGQSGVIEIIQSSTGSDTIGTWGSSYVTAGGVATVTLSVAANATDFLPYYVVDATHIVLGAIIAGPTH